MKNALILHGWYCTPDEHWYKSVANSLEHKEYTVSIPFLRDNEKPTLQDWTKHALGGSTLDKDTVLIGHSLGSVLAMKLAQNLESKIDHLILTSAWDFWDLTPQHETFFEEPINHAKILRNVNKITVLNSDNDPYVTAYHSIEMGKRLNTDTIFVKDGGHLLESDGFKELPQLLAVI